jgi:hypothetical protein
VTLERKDLRLKLDDDDHQRLRLIAESEGCEMAEWAEKVLVDVMRARIHKATVLADKARRSGLSGNELPEKK